MSRCVVAATLSTHTPVWWMPGTDVSHTVPG